MNDDIRSLSKKIWYASRDNSWQSLKQGVDTIYNYGQIDISQHQNIRDALSTLERLEASDPISYSELSSRLDYYV